MTERVNMAPAERMQPLNETWAEIIRHVTVPGQQVELVVDIANWVFASILLRNLRIPVEDGVMAWPPDSVRPANAED